MYVVQIFTLRFYSFLQFSHKSLSVLKHAYISYVAILITKQLTIINNKFKKIIITLGSVLQNMINYYV